jgi:hypothetical protein
MSHFTFYDDDEQPNAAQERLEYSLRIDRQIERMFDAQQKARERARLANGPEAKVDPLQFWKEHSLEFRAQNVMVLILSTLASRQQVQQLNVFSAKLLLSCASIDAACLKSWRKSCPCAYFSSESNLLPVSKCLSPVGLVLCLVDCATLS